MALKSDKIFKLRRKERQKILSYNVRTPSPTLPFVFTCREKFKEKKKNSVQNAKNANTIATCKNATET